MANSKITVAQAFNRVNYYREDCQKAYDNIQDKTGLIKTWREFVLACLAEVNENGGTLEDLEFIVSDSVRGLEERVEKENIQ